MKLENYIKIAQTMGLMNCSVDIAVETINKIVKHYSFLPETELAKMDAISLWLGIITDEEDYVRFINIMEEAVIQLHKGKNYEEAITIARIKSVI